MKYILVFTICLLLTSCFWGKEEEGPAYKSGSAIRSGRDAKVPKDLVEKIEKHFVEFVRKEDPANTEKEIEIMKSIERGYLDVYVKFTQERKAALASNFQFAMPRGGGVIDFAEYVTGTKGSFRVQLDVKMNDDPKEEVTQFYSYFVSNSRKRKIGAKEFGNGCNLFMKMDSFLKQMQSKGVLVNATQQRNVSVLAGTFYLYLFKGRQMYLGTLSFEDSRFPEIQCESQSQTSSTEV